MSGNQRGGYQGRGGDGGGGRGRGRGRGGADNFRGGGGGGRGGYGGAGRGGPVQVYSTQTGIPPPDPAVAKVEDALQTAAKDPLSLAKLKLKSDFPQRPGYGTRGAKVVLWANYVQLVPSSNLVLYRYDIAVLPAVAGKKMTQVIRLLLEEPELAAMKDDIVTDFKSTMISKKKLPQDDKTYEIQYRSEGEDEPLADALKYKIRILYTNTLNVSELIKYITSTNVNDSFDDKQTIVQAFNIFLNHYAKSAGNLATIGSSKTFSLGPNAAKWDLGSGLTAIRGFFSSVRVAAARILINVQVSHGAFFNEGPLENLMYEYLSTHHQSRPALGKFLNKVRVRVTHLPARKNKKGEVVHRARGIFGLANKNDGYKLDKPPKIKDYGAGAKDVEFWLDGAPNTSTQSGKGEGKKGKGKGGAGAPASATGGRYITVFDFFKTAHNITLKHPNLPVVNTGTREKPTYLPAEVCIVMPGQNSKSKLDPSQTQKMIGGAVRQPWQNAKSIMEEGLQSAGLDSRTNILLGKFGLNITPSLLTVPGRVLAEPKINYKANKSANPRNGSWNMIDIKFNTTASVKSWSYVMISTPGSRDAFRDQQELGYVMQRLHGKLVQMGLNVPAPLPGRRLALNGPDDPLLGNTIKGAAEKLTLLFFILPDANTPVYARIKRDADIRYGIHTICSVGAKLAKQNGQDQYFANLALKINLKLGGINQMVDNTHLGIINADKTMIVGIDVTHPSPGSSSSAPSVAGMVASIDRYLGQWPATLRVQTARQENVADLTTMLKSRLQLWKTKGKHSSYPENILIYRDGVSEGQYSIVLDTELPLLRKAAAELYPAPDQKKGLPKFTIVIAGKRHKTRFYPTSAQDADQKSANCKPGTVVDRGVTESRNWDFFLQAHAALQGTARPCHYYIVLDEIFRSAFKPGTPAVPAGCQNTADVLEDLTHALCYLFGRATKAVSLCPPAYYADIVCERARCYLVDVFDSPNPSVAMSVKGGQGGGGVGNDEVRVHERLRDSMFYL